MTTDVTISAGGAATYQLREAILLYHGPSDDVYATLHKIERHRKGGPRLAAGIPATREACAAFARAISDRAAFRGFLSDRILFVGPRVIAWWRAPAKASMFFSADDADRGKTRLGERAGTSPQPGLVFMLIEGQWLVFAVKGSARPTPQSPLFRAPYFNVNEHGHICEGDVARPQRVDDDTLGGFERAFFGSRFTSPNATSKQLTSHKGGVYKLWQDLVEGKLREFPERSLVRHGKHTLESLLRRLEKKGSEDA
jgi:PRTRC genetic system protein B